MFQCLGLATEADGGCGEDWWHPECIVGLGRGWAQKMKSEPKATTTEAAADEEDVDESALPPGFPEEDAFETFICYKCVDAHAWIRRYAGSEGFLPPIYRQSGERHKEVKTAKSDTMGDSANHAPRAEQASDGDASHPGERQATPDQTTNSKKRKASEDPAEPTTSSSDPKKPKIAPSTSSDPCTYSSHPYPPPRQLNGLQPQ